MTTGNRSNLDALSAAVTRLREGRVTADCFNCPWRYYGAAAGIEVAGEALVFVGQVHESELEGTETVRWMYPTDQTYERCWDSTTGQPAACTYFTGGIQCRSLRRTDGTADPELCTLLSSSGSIAAGS